MKNREEKITLQEIADWLGISVSFLSLIRSSKRGMDPKTAVSIQNKFGIPCGSLVFGTGEARYKAIKNAYILVEGWKKAYRKVNR